MVRFAPHFSRAGHNGPPPWGIMDHPYDFLGVQKLTSILLFEYQNVVLVRIFHGLAHFFFKKVQMPWAHLARSHDLIYTKKKTKWFRRQLSHSFQWKLLHYSWMDKFWYKNIFTIVKFGGPLCPAWKRSIMPHLTFLTWHKLWRKWH